MRASAGHAVAASVVAACKELHLPTVAARSSSLAEEAARANEGHLSYLSALLEAECEDRAERRRHRPVVEARFPRLKRLEDFNFSEAPQIPAATVRELATGSFIDRAETVILLGEPGTGKSHLSIALRI
jgi:DNA replication protein DnaC